MPPRTAARIPRPPWMADKAGEGGDRGGTATKELEAPADEGGDPARSTTPGRAGASLRAVPYMAGGPKRAAGWPAGGEPLARLAKDGQRGAPLSAWCGAQHRGGNTRRFGRQPSGVVCGCDPDRQSRPCGFCGELRLESSRSLSRNARRVSSLG